MEKELLDKISELKEKIDEYPKGCITKKTIKGEVYYYHQWMSNGQRHSEFLSEKEISKLNYLIEERKRLQSELKSLKYLSKKNIYISSTLMMKNEAVVDLIIDKETSLIVKVNTIHNQELLPIGTTNLNGTINIDGFSNWWSERSIPKSRSGVKEALEKLNLDTPTSLIVKCHGLSLTDQYWIKEKGEELKWEDINFFNNAFSEDIGGILFGAESKKDINLSSPDSTSIGNLKKRWTIINGYRALIKGGSNPFRQEPINEVVASKIMDHLNISHVEYTLIYDKGYPYSICNDFVDDNHELITAYQIQKTTKRYNDESVYQHMVRCLRQLGYKDASKELNKMIVIDYLIGNEDRHLNNFGFLRDVRTLKIVSISPIFDSGSSFGFDKINEEILPFDGMICKPFKSTHLEELKLIDDFSFIDINKLDDIVEIAFNTFNEYESNYLPNNRIHAIKEALKERVKYLKTYIKEVSKK